MYILLDSHILKHVFEVYVTFTCSNLIHDKPYGLLQLHIFSTFSAYTNKVTCRVCNIQLVMLSHRHNKVNDKTKYIKSIIRLITNY